MENTIKDTISDLEQIIADLQSTDAYCAELLKDSWYEEENNDIAQTINMIKHTIKDLLQYNSWTRV